MAVAWPPITPHARFKKFDTLKGFIWSGPCAIFQRRCRGARYVEYCMVGAGPEANKTTHNALSWLWAQRGGGHRGRAHDKMVFVLERLAAWRHTTPHKKIDPRLGPYPATVDKELRPKLCSHAPETCGTTCTIRARHMRTLPTGTTTSHRPDRQDALLGIDMRLGGSDGESSEDGPSDGPASADDDEAGGILPVTTRGASATWLRLTRGGLHCDAWKAIFDRVDMSRCVLVPPAHTPTGLIRAALMHNEVC